MEVMLFQIGKAGMGEQKMSYIYGIRIEEREDFRHMLLQTDIGI
jgi:hypothetical protein